MIIEYADLKADSDEKINKSEQKVMGTVDPD